MANLLLAETRRSGGGSEEAVLKNPMFEPDDKNDRVVYILCGLSGSGKTTVAEKKVALNKAAGVQTLRLSTNDWFKTPDGSWKFDPDRLDEYHKLMHADFTAALEAGDGVVLIDNTNIMDWHRRPFIYGAKRFGYRFEFVVFGETPFDQDWAEFCAARTAHGVGIEYISAMAQRFDDPAGGRSRTPYFVSYVPKTSLGWTPDWKTKC